MKEILREAYFQFERLHHLLDTPMPHDQEYYTQLSIASEEAYVLMNEGMCANTSICRECAEHRDFIRSMLEILSELEVSTAHSGDYTAHFARYAERVNTILTNITGILSS